MKFKAAAIIALSLLAASCKERQAAPRQTIHLVETIIEDTEGAQHSALSGFDKTRTRADIVILDEPLRALGLSERFLCCDLHDNIDGSASFDLLPDFAGERVAAILDVTNTPYSSLAAAGNIERVRELAVLGTIAAVDTVCRIGTFDTDLRGHRRPAKIVVISSPTLAAFGAFDVDTLCKACGAAIPVVVPLLSAAKEVLERHSAPVVAGVIGDAAAASAYETAFREIAAQRGDSLSRCICVPSAGRDPLRSFLAAYSEAGHTAPVSTILVDDPDIRMDELKQTFIDINLAKEESDIMFRELLVPDFEFVNISETALQECYSILRGKSLFTHDILYPVGAAYMTVPGSEGISLMEYDSSCLPDGAEEYLMLRTPKTYESYVQNQYIPGGAR